MTWRSPVQMSRRPCSMVHAILAAFPGKHMGILVRTSCGHEGAPGCSMERAVLS